MLGMHLHGCTCILPLYCMLSAQCELHRETSPKEKPSEIILLLFSCENWCRYRFYPADTLHCQQYLLLGKYCPNMKTVISVKGADSCANTQESSGMKFPFLPIREYKKKSKLSYQGETTYCVCKAVMEISAAFFKPLYCLQHTALSGIISASHLKILQERT